MLKTKSEKRPCVKSKCTLLYSPPAPSRRRAWHRTWAHGRKNLRPLSLSHALSPARVFRARPQHTLTILKPAPQQLQPEDIARGSAFPSKWIKRHPRAAIPCQYGHTPARAMGAAAGRFCCQWLKFVCVCVYGRMAVGCLDPLGRGKQSNIPGGIFWFK